MKVIETVAPRLEKREDWPEIVKYIDAEFKRMEMNHK